MPFQQWFSVWQDVFDAICADGLATEDYKPSMGLRSHHPPWSGHCAGHRQVELLDRR